MLNNPRFEHYIAEANKKELERMEQHVLLCTFMQTRETSKSRFQRCVDALRNHWHFIFVGCEVGYLGVVASFASTAAVSIAATLLGLLFFAALAFHLDE